MSESTKNNVTWTARTKSTVDTTKDGEISVVITGLPTEKETSGATIGAMRIILLYDAIENWCKEKFGDDHEFPAVVEDARKQLNMKSRYSPTKVTE